MDSIKAKVQAELAPMQQKGQEELNQYAASLQKELAAKRDTMVQQQAQSIIANNNLPMHKTGMILGLKSFQIKKLK